MPQDCCVFSALTTKVSSGGQLTSAFGSDRAQARSLQEGHQLPNPLGVLSLGRLVGPAICPYSRALGPGWHANPLQGIAPAPAAPGCSADPLVLLSMSSPGVGWGWLGEGPVEGQSSAAEVGWVGT